MLEGADAYDGVERLVSLESFVTCQVNTGSWQVQTGYEVKLVFA